MLWRFRREIVFIFFILIGLWCIKHNLSFRVSFFKHKPELKEYSQKLQDFIIENENLRKLLNLKKKTGFSKVVYATTTSVSPWVFPTLITIDKGLRDGIKENMAIISCNGFLVGRITSVGETSATGITLYHPESKISVMVTRTGELAVMEGLSVAPLSSHLKIKFLPSECKACPGDIVETSGFTRFYPSGVKIGRIVKIDSSKTEPVTHGYVKPFFIYENLRTVGVVE